MAIAAITKQGLWTMAILVAVLWGCLVGERLTVQRANREMAQVLQEMGRSRQIKERHTVPAAWPRRPGVRVRPAAS
jgi:hypothetical protein